MFYLAVPATTDAAPAARELVSYLTSEGVRARFLTQTAIELYGAGSFAENLLIVPSIADKVRDPAMRPLIEWLDSQR